uniref:Putative secreted protein n=1 Tax=Ixodes ricinus TaxID=34613 RepID=A0A6B0UM53_IXORI
MLRSRTGLQLGFALCASFLGRLSMRRLAAILADLNSPMEVPLATCASEPGFTPCPGGPSKRSLIRAHLGDPDKGPTERASGPPSALRAATGMRDSVRQPLMLCSPVRTCCRSSVYPA